MGHGLGFAQGGDGAAEWSRVLEYCTRIASARRCGLSGYFVGAVQREPVLAAEAGTALKGAGPVVSGAARRAGAARRVATGYQGQLAE
eukprot:gene8933-biopygen7658